MFKKKKNKLKKLCTRKEKEKSHQEIELFILRCFNSPTSFVPSEDKVRKYWTINTDTHFKINSPVLLILDQDPI